jgi:molecular chaperone Hsp33
VKVNEKGEVEKSGGFIIQLLPGVEDDFIDKIEKKIESIKSVTDLLDGRI